MNIVISRGQAAVPLTSPLGPREVRNWSNANQNILWGWKRDVGEQSRLVYFSGTMGRGDEGVSLDRYYLHYRARLPHAESAALIDDVERARARFAAIGNAADLRIDRKRSQVNVEFRFGLPAAEDEDRVHRLKLRRPRRRIVTPTLPSPTDNFDPAALWPADLYVGSGLSYEAGLPTLCDMHDVFCVDNETQDGFTVGASDRLPALLADEGVERLKAFCQVHTKALFAEPTLAMRAIADLVAANKVRRIFTDNVDNVLSMTDVPYERVRGSGVFNERHEVDFASPRLVVVGVAADRRQIVRQARAAGLVVVVVNPCKKVSPNVTHLDYVRPTDLFFKCEAETFFAKGADLKLRQSAE